jgi:hypothetical protein
MQKTSTASLAVSVLSTILVGSAYFIPSFQLFGARSVSNAEASVGSAIVADPPSTKPEIYTGNFNYTTVEEMLSAQGIRLNPEDKVYAFPPPEYGLGSTKIEVFRAQSVLTTVSSKNLPVKRTWAKTVGAYLADQHIAVNPGDIVQPPVSAPIVASSKLFHIAIARIVQSTVTVTKITPFATLYKDDSQVDQGTVTTIQKGQNEVREQSYAITQKDGMELSRVLSSSVIIQAEVDQVVMRGTKVPPPPPTQNSQEGLASWYGGVPAFTAAHKTLPFGTRVTVTNKANGKSVVVKIADRGPFVARRIIDLDTKAFTALASPGEGVISVSISY